MNLLSLTPDQTMGSPGNLACRFILCVYTKGFSKFRKFCQEVEISVDLFHKIVLKEHNPLVKEKSSVLKMKKTLVIFWSKLKKSQNQPKDLTWLSKSSPPSNSVLPCFRYAAPGEYMVSIYLTCIDQIARG